MVKPITDTKRLKNVVNASEQTNIVIHDIQDDKAFKKFLVDLVVTRGNIQPIVAEKLFDDNGLPRMKKAFTHWSFDELDYEQLETLGDVTVNKCVVWYLYRRFPELRNNDKGAFIITEAKKNLIKKGTLSRFSKQLGLNKWIRYKEYTYTENNIQKKIVEDDSMREDVFESFCGALEDLIDNRIMFTLGYSTVYALISSFLDTQEISIDIQDLVSTRTKLKEIFDAETKAKRDNFIEYITEADNSTVPATLTVRLIMTFNDRRLPNGRVAPSRKEFVVTNVLKKEDGQEEVAKQALGYLKGALHLEWPVKKN
jgi:dsRNA-specific ribonuclease